MKTLVITIVIFNFIVFIVGAFTVFSKPTDKGDSRAFSSSIIILSMIYLLILVAKSVNVPVQNLAAGFILNLSSIYLFFYTAKSIQRAQFSPIFSSDKPTTLILNGPYRYIRHPFYTSYLLAFAGATIYTNSLLALPAALVIYYIYYRASEQEEFKFFHSELKDDYLSYMQRIGRFFPRLF